jgi:TPR repeat protein
VTSSIQVSSADDGSSASDSDSIDSPQPESNQKQIPLRVKVGLIGMAGLLNVVVTMWMLYPFLPHGKSLNAIGLDAPAKQGAATVMPKTQAPPEAVDALVQEALTQLLASMGGSKSLPAMDSPSLKSIQTKLHRAESEGSHKAEYLLGLLDYLIGLTSHNNVLQNEGALRIRAAADAGLYLARFDSAVLLRKPYPLDDDHYKAARNAAAQGFMPANVDVARYLSNIGKDIEALPTLELLHAWDGAPQSAGGDPLSAFRLSLSGAVTGASLRQYAGVSKYLLAMLLVEGKVVAVDLARAQRLLAEAARDGVAAASVAHAKMLLTGQGSAATPRLAAEYLLGLLEHQSAENSCALLFEECSQVHRDAAAYLVALNHYAATPGFEKVRNAATLLQPLADKGDADAKSLLGMVLAEGIETRADPAKGFVLLTEAAEAGVVDAKYWLGRCYLDGKGTKKDVVKAAAYFTDAAAAGHEDAGAALAALKKR